MEGGGRALAFGEAVVGTQEVRDLVSCHCCFYCNFEVILTYVFMFCQLNQHWGASDAGTSSTSTRPVLSTVGKASASIVGIDVGHGGDGWSRGVEGEHQDGSQAAMAMDVDTTEQV